MEVVTEIIASVAVGAVAGFVNTVAGGGSTLTLPLLVALGLTPTVANATNRVAVLFQSIAATREFKSQNILTREHLRFSWVGATGTLIGAVVASQIDDAAFAWALLVIFLGLGVIETRRLLRPRLSLEAVASPRESVAQLGMFFVGVYAGFIQAGVGLLMVVVLRRLAAQPLPAANAAKSWYTLVFTIVALAVFWSQSLVAWTHGISLGIGGAFGAVAGAKMASRSGSRWVEWALVAAIWLAALRFGVEVFRHT